MFKRFITVESFSLELLVTTLNFSKYADYNLIQIIPKDAESYVAILQQK